MHARGAACMTTAAESAAAVNAPSVAHSVPSEEDRPSDVRPFDRATESARAAAAAVPASYASQPAKLVSSSPSLLLSLLVCFAEGCQAIENVILPVVESWRRNKNHDKRKIVISDKII